VAEALEAEAATESRVTKRWCAGKRIDPEARGIVCAVSAL